MAKKKIVIPRNVNARFEMLNLNWKDGLVMLPFVIAAWRFLTDVEAPLQMKVIVPVVLVAIPYMFIVLKPKRANIPAWKHLWWKIRFKRERKNYYYRKEGVKLANQYKIQVERDAGRKAETEREGNKPTVNSGVRNKQRNSAHIG